MLERVRLIADMDAGAWQNLRYRALFPALTEPDLSRSISYLKWYEVTCLDLLKTHALHLSGHRYQIRYIRGAYSRAHGTRKADSDPW